MSAELSIGTKIIIPESKMEPMMLNNIGTVIEFNEEFVDWMVGHKIQGWFEGSEKRENIQLA